MRVVPVLLNTNRMGSVPMHLLLAVTPQEQMQGFRGRPGPPDDHTGMLFFFAAPRPAVFNMRDVPFDLELVVGRADGAVLGICGMQANSFLEYAPNGPISFAIELRAGWSTRNGLPVRMAIP